MDRDFSTVMKQKSSSELLEIVTKLKDEYQPEAVEAAQMELDSRDLTNEQQEEAESQIADRTSANLDMQSEPLGAGQKLLFFIFFWGVIPWAMAGTFKNNGYLRKYKDAWRFMGLGALVFVGIPLVIILVFSFFY